MPPAQALVLFGDLELVKFVKFDGKLQVDLVDLRLRE